MPGFMNRFVFPPFGGRWMALFGFPPFGWRWRRFGRRFGRRWW